MRNNKGQFTSDLRPEKRNGKILKCQWCGKEEYIIKYRINIYKYCSHECSNHKGLRKNTGRTHFKKGFNPWNKGIKTGLIPRTAFKRNDDRIIGKNHWNWQGGITPISIKLRMSFEYEEWRKSVFERDLYTCQICSEVGGVLNADHIKPFSLFPELRLELSNGRTLCEDCHKKTKSYLNAHLKREDFL